MNERMAYLDKELKFRPSSAPVFGNIGELKPFNKINRVGKFIFIKYENIKYVP